MSEKIGYARVSTRDQHTVSQIEQLRAVGCTKLFADYASGKTARDRTELGNMLSYLRPGDMVVVTKLDRLSRSLTDLLALVKDIGEKGAQLRSLGEDIDTSSSQGKLIFHVMGVLAEYERDRIRERTLEGLKIAREQGRIGGRPRKLDDQKIELVQLLHKQGRSMREIARLLSVSVGTISRTLKRLALEKTQVRKNTAC